MKGRSAELGRNWVVVMGVAALALCVVSGVRAANTTNDIPYSESFESIPQGTLLSGTGGWYGTSNAVQVVPGDPGFLYGYPIPGAHTNALELTDSVSNLFVVGETDGSGGAPAGVNNPPWVTQRTFIDMMVKPVPRDSAPANLDSNVQVAVYLDSAGFLNIYHRYRQNFNLVPAAGETEALWTALTNTVPIPTNEWFRLTITMGYLVDPWSSFPDANNDYDVFFQVKVNGGEGLTGEFGMDQPSTLSGNLGNGSWFVAANTGAYGVDSDQVGNPHYYLTSVATEGPGMIDDLVVTTDSNALGSVISPYGINAATYANAGISNPEGDDDGDGVPNWEELVAGTDPGSSDSMFRVLNQTYMGSKNVVVFQASDMYVVGAMVTMMRSTNTLTSPVWQPVGAPIAPDASGVNTFEDSAPPAGLAYYKPVIGWNY